MEEDCHPHLYAGVCFVCIDGYFTLVPAIDCSEARGWNDKPHPRY